MSLGLWVEELALLPHPEGGYYRETYRSDSCTVIYFALGPGDVSHFHRIDRDEIWFWHAGAPLAVHTLAPRADHMLCAQHPQLLVPAGVIFGATVPSGASALVSCVVSPPFHFAGFELCGRRELLAAYPDEAALVTRLTAPPH